MKSRSRLRAFHGICTSIYDVCMSVYVCTCSMSDGAVERKGQEMRKKRRRSVSVCVRERERPPTEDLPPVREAASQILCYFFALGLFFELCACVRACVRACVCVCVCVRESVRDCKCLSRKDIPYVLHNRHILKSDYLYFSLKHTVMGKLYCWRI